MEMHADEEIKDIIFKRHILESVIIQEKREFNNILILKSEYNPCSIPRLTTKMGEKEIKKWEKNRSKTTKLEKDKEAEVKRKIYEIRKEKMKERRQGEKDTLPTKI